MLCFVKSQEILHSRSKIYILLLASDAEQRCLFYKIPTDSTIHTFHKATWVELGRRSLINIEKTKRSKSKRVHH